MEIEYINAVFFLNDDQLSIAKFSNKCKVRCRYFDEVEFDSFGLGIKRGIRTRIGFYSQELDRISTKTDSMSMLPPERRQSARPSQRGVFGLFGCLDGCGSLHPVADGMDVVQRLGRRVLHGPVVQRTTLRNVTITIPEYVIHGGRWGGNDGMLC